MSTYQFTMHNGATVDNLGSLSLTNDPEALAFCDRMIRDLMRQYPDQYSGWTVSVKEGGRVVGRVTVE
jgi:hypothetical protein